VITDLASIKDWTATTWIALVATIVAIGEAIFGLIVFRLRIRTRVIVSIARGTAHRSGHISPGIVIGALNRSGHDVFIDDVRMIWDGKDKRVPLEWRRDNRVMPHSKYQVAMPISTLAKHGLVLPAEAKAILILDTGDSFESKITHLE
jgi:hypothetical protein